MTDTEDKRPEPESLLEIARQEETAKKSVKLTIYFGAAPGGGKTYSMLYDARMRKQEGIDVVIGYVETHGRSETEALLKGLETIPLVRTEYKGVRLSEMDLDAVLARRPGIVLVDELAHTNAPNSRHGKRYQDVEELLNAGIDVYSTLNVQHLESLNDIVFRITGIRVSETIPDTFFQLADEIKLVDLPFEELLKRLKEGKVYAKDMAENAVKRFFKPGNLLALREMSLRLVAGSVDEKMLLYMRAHAIAGPWSATERVLVGVLASPYAEQLVRSAFRIASDLSAEWVALYVETASHTQLSDKEQEWLKNALDLAEKLGARVVWTKGDDVAEEIARYAQGHNVTKIVIGKPRRFGLFPTLARKILVRTRDIDVFLFAGKSEQPVPKKKIGIINPLNYVMSGVAVILGSLFGFLLRDILGQVNLLFLMLLPVVIIAIFLGRGASIFAAILSVLIFDFLFIPPYFSFAVSDVRYFLSYLMFIAFAFVISNLASNLQYKVQQLQQSESRTITLYGLSRDLVTAQSIEQVLHLMIRHTGQIFPCDMAIFLPGNGEVSVRASTDGFRINPKELSIATWVWLNGEPAGLGTDTLPEAWAYYLPMKTADTIKGVVGFHFDSILEVLTPENKVVLDTIARLGALAIERIGSKDSKE
ncbi:Osmosensitive K+ channel His kinase sensor domain protein [uncultured archaeon]|nr:Osmosensitive K+ channel His kinase sensor domain protein [uncultured archaeon]